MGETRVSIRDAARILDISEGAIRKRIKRGTLRTEKGSDGRVYVFVEEGEARGARGTDAGIPEGADALISEMRERIDDLRGQLEAEREANRENRRIIAALTSRIPELESGTSSGTPSEASGSTETVETEESRGPVGVSPQEATGRPWWRRLFGS